MCGCWATARPSTSHRRGAGFAAPASIPGCPSEEGFARRSGVPFHQAMLRCRVVACRLASGARPGQRHRAVRPTRWPVETSTGLMSRPGCAAPRRRPSTRSTSSIVPKRSRSLVRLASSALQGFRRHRRQIPRMLVGWRQRHRPARASSMIRRVSDRSPSPPIWSSSNQRASAASSPGTSSAPCASAVKSIRV